jgi:LuxR family transcriptional regulator, maltose regulon positive regulatory protein
MISILRTKITIPPTSPRVVARSRLLDCLQEGNCRTLTLLVAPAGYGKTTLVASWVQTCNKAVAWLSLQPQERQRDLFFTHLIKALQDIDVHIGQSSLAMMRMGSFEAALFALVNDLAEIEHDFSLVLDDYHNVDSPETAEILQFLIENRPSVFHLVVVTRVEPLLNLTRLRALDQVIEITSEDLRFTISEMEAFFNSCMGLQLKAEDIEHLNRSIEGWVVGMQLAGLAVANQPSAWAASAGQEYIFDYLANEVLHHETQEVQEFLKKSSLFERFCTSLLAYATPSEHDSNQSEEHYKMLLSYVERANLFLLRLDQAGVWYRYHGLFSDFLNRMLSVEQVQQIYFRASHWFEKNGFIDEAIQYAIQAADYQRAADLMEDSYIDLLARSEQAAIAEWIKAIPEEVICHRPRLWLAQGWASIISLNHQEAKKCLGKAEGILTEVNNRAQIWKEAKSLRILINILSGEMVSPDEISSIIYTLTDQDDFLRSLLYFNLGSGQMFLGESAQAVNSFKKALSYTQKNNNPLLSIMVMAALGENLQICGQFAQAKNTFQEAIRFAKDTLGEHTFLLGYPYNNYSDLLREQNCLDEAIHYAEMGISYCMVWQPVASLDGQIVMARLLASQGNWEESFQRLELARQLMAKSGLSIADLYISIHTVRQLLLQGNLERASHEIKVNNLEEASSNTLLVVNKFIQLVLYRFETMRVNTNPQAARLLIEHLSSFIEEAQQYLRVTHMIEALILRAYAQDSVGQTSTSSHSLEKALSMGAYSGYVRIFVDEGERLLDLLEKYRSRIHAPEEYLEKIMDLLRQETARTAPEVLYDREGLTSLTRRELDVLALLASGKTNQEIADELVLAISTVKKHVANILGKLGVANRTQAVLLAKKLGWLE